MIFFQVLLDHTSIQLCLAKHYGIPESDLNNSLIQQANISMGAEISLCNTDTPTTHYPEVRDQVIYHIFVSLYEVLCQFQHQGFSVRAPNWCS